CALPIFKLDDRRDRLLGHVLDGVLIPQPVAPLDGVISVPAPVIFPHVAQRRSNTALRCHGMTAGREQLGHASRGQPGIGQATGCAQTGAAGPYHHDVMLVIDNSVARAHPAAPRTIMRTEIMAATASRMLMNCSPTIVAIFTHSTWM